MQKEHFHGSTVSCVAVSFLIVILANMLVVANPAAAPQQVAQMNAWPDFLTIMHRVLLE